MTLSLLLMRASSLALSLRRTIVTAAVHKNAISLVPTLVKLQQANDVIISTLAHSSRGIHTFLHASATVLRKKQNERLCKAGMLSVMGDGSNDRKTIEQVLVNLLKAASARSDPPSLCTGNNVRALSDVQRGPCSLPGGLAHARRVFRSSQR